jgi:hypothetical protein
MGDIDRIKRIYCVGASITEIDRDMSCDGE